MPFEMSPFFVVIPVLRNRLLCIQASSGRSGCYGNESFPAGSLISLLVTGFRNLKHPTSHSVRSVCLAKARRSRKMIESR